jgi:uncharacterized protein (TIGR03083 family)
VFLERIAAGPEGLMTRIDTRPLFRPLCADIVSVLRALSPADWERPTLAGAWRVRELAAHLLDTALRRLSFHRDGLPPLSPARPLAGERDFVGFINDLNATWIVAARRLSPRVLTDLYDHASRQLCAFIETLPEDAPALFPVSWAGDRGAAGWLDVGREFTEIWHHGAQIREAVGAGPFENPQWLRAVLDISLHALPHVYRDVESPDGTTVGLRLSGPSGGTWTLRRAGGRWEIDAGTPSIPTAAVTMTDETAWRLFYNALPAAAAESAVRAEGDDALTTPLLRARSVIV